MFNQYISDIDFRISFQDDVNLNFNGHLENAQIIFSGKRPECIFNDGRGSMSGEIKIKGAPNICNNFFLTPHTTLTLAANLKGDLQADADSHITITRNLEGLVRLGSRSKLLVNGKLIAEDLLNADFNQGSIILGCDATATIKQGLELNTSNLILKYNSELDTPRINLISKSDMISLPNTLATIHLYPNSKIIHNLDEHNKLNIMNNPEGEISCYDKYLIYLGSSYDEKKQSFYLQADDNMESRWQCQDAPEENKLCN